MMAPAVRRAATTSASAVAGAISARDLLLQRVGEAAADVLRGYTPRSVVNKAVLDRVSLAPSPDHG